jgi:hypothetical protein
MCIIAAQQMGSPPLASDILANCWKENPHGAGYMFCDGGNVIIRKAFFKLEELEGSYREDHGRYGQSSPFVLHFRWATHGSKNELNTHPHPIIPGNVAIVHNGVLRVQIPKGEDISDTIAYVRQHLSWKTPKQLLGAKMRRRLEGEIGWQNKFVILRGDGELSIVNEREGEWADGVWYSNSSYRPQLATYYVNGQGSLWDDEGDDAWASWRRLQRNHEDDALDELWDELMELEELEWDAMTEDQWKRRHLLEEILYDMEEEQTRYLLRDDAA